MLIWGDTLFVVVAALAFDALIGDPDWLWRRLPHPVALIRIVSSDGSTARSISIRGHRRQRTFAGVGVIDPAPGHFHIDWMF